MHGCVCIFVEKGRNDGVARQKLGLENIPLKMTEMKSSSSFKRSFALVSPFGSLILWPPSAKWKVRFADSVRQPNPSCIYRKSPKTLSLCSDTADIKIAAAILLTAFSDVVGWGIVT